MILPKNDEARAFFIANNYPQQYNDGLVAYLRDILQVSNYTLPDLLRMYRDTFGEDLDTIFSPASLFSNGEVGAWWDVQDTSTLFSDTAMTTLAVVDGLVAAHTDKSGNGNHRIQSTEGSRPTLRQHSDGRYYLDYSGGKLLEVPTSTATFKFLHDGTGMTLAAYVEWLQGATTSNYIQTSGTSTNSGIRLLKNTSTQAITFNIDRAVSGTPAIAQISLDNFCVSSAPHFMCFSYKNDGGSDDGIGNIDYPRDLTVRSTSATPSSANASLSFRNNSTWVGREYELIVINRVLTLAEKEKLYVWMRTRNGYPVNNINYTFLLGGQSNMSGRGSLTSPSLPEEILIGAYTYNKAEEFNIAFIPEHSLVNQSIATSPTEPSSVGHGFALRMAKNLKTNSNINSLLVPCAIGSTSISQWNTPSTVDDRTTLFGAMKYRYEKASTKGGTPIILWYGHEADAADAVPDYTNGGVGTTYKDNFISLINTVRNNIVDAPLIFIQLASDDIEADALNHAAAGEALRQVEQELTDVYLVPAYDVKRNASPDDIHVSREGQDTIADRVALAVREHILGEGVNGTGPRLQSISFLGDQVTITFDKEIQASGTNYDSLFRVYSNGSEVTVNSAERGTNTSTIILTCASFLTSPLTVTYGYRAGVVSAARTDIVKDTDNFPTPVFGPVLDPVVLGSEIVSTQQTTDTNSAGGAVYTHDPVLRSITVTGAGTSDSYPRLRLNLGLVSGRTYRIAGTITGNPGNVSTVIPMRLALSGTANNVPYNPTTGRFGGDIVAGGNTFEVLLNGTLTGTVTIGSITCREVL